MSLLKKASIINSGAIAGIVIGTAQTIILTRALGPQGVGQYALSVAFLSLMVSIFAFGCPLSFLFYAKQKPEEKNVYFINAFWMLLCIGALTGGAISALFQTQKGYFGQYSPYIYLLITAFLPAALLRLLFRNHLLIRIQATKLAVVELAAISSSTLFIVGAWYLHRLTVNVALFSFVLATVVRVGLGWIWIRREVKISIAPNRGYAAKLGYMGAKQMWPDLLSVLNDQVSILLLKWLIPEFDLIGFFSRAVSIATMLILLSRALMPVLFSSWAGLAEHAIREQAEKVLRFVTTFSLAMMILLMLFGNFIVVLLYGDEFLAAATPMRILAAGTAFNVVSRTLIQLFSGRGMPEKGTYAMICGAIVTASLSMLLIPVWRIVGCSIAISTGQLIVMLSLFRYAKANFHLSIKRSTLINLKELNLTLRSLLNVKAAI